MKSDFQRSFAATFNRTANGIMVVVAVMWIATAADYFLSLGWGWDEQGLWIAPIILAVAILIRLAGNAIIRFADNVTH